MNGHIKKDEDNDRVFFESLKEVTKELDEALRCISTEKSKEWGVDVEFIPHQLVRCRHSMNNLCSKDTRRAFEMCSHYREMRIFFLKCGLILFPYTLDTIDKNKSINTKKVNMGFYYPVARNVIFVCSTCFENKYRGNTRKSAVNSAFHEFFNVMKHEQYKDFYLLLESIDNGDLERFITQNNLWAKMIEIYKVEEKIPENEIKIRYLANNKDTMNLLESFITRVRKFNLPEVLHKVKEKLTNLIDMLKEKRANIMGVFKD